MNYQDWAATIPAEFTDDPLWTVEVYRLGLLAAEVGWHDVTRLIKDQRTAGLAEQLYRAVGAISANIAAGYSHGHGRDRLRFYEQALGSARESRDWYYKGRHILQETVIEHRLNLLSQIIRALSTIIAQQRDRALHEAGSSYETETKSLNPEISDSLLQNIPLPQ